MFLWEVRSNLSGLLYRGIWVKYNGYNNRSGKYLGDVIVCCGFSFCKFVYDYELAYPKCRTTFSDAIHMHVNGKMHRLNTTCIVVTQKFRAGGILNYE